MAQEKIGEGAALGEILLTTVLGGLHALRNALQVVRSYSQASLPPGPPRDASLAGLEKGLDVMAGLELLLSPQELDPAPEEISRTLEIFPELFVYELRKRRIRLVVEKAALPRGVFLFSSLPLLAACLLEDLMKGGGGGAGEIRLSFTGEELRLWWEPEPGTLPFPPLRQRPGAAARRLAESRGLQVEPLEGLTGFLLSNPGGKVRQKEVFS